MAEAGKQFIWATGRRKTSVARVRMAEGTGKILVNGRAFENYFPVEQQRNDAGAPLVASNAREKWDVWVNVMGGGPTGQSGAVSLGLARALRKAEPTLDELLRGGGFLTRDSRMVERKKYGQRKARRRFQFSKR
jgi:small subunit ribosomal protein S9